MAIIRIQIPRISNSYKERFFPPFDHTEFILHRQQVLSIGNFSASGFYRLTCVLQMGKK
jgi:hypothetical protein